MIQVSVQRVFFFSPKLFQKFEQCPKDRQSFRFSKDGYGQCWTACVRLNGSLNLFYTLCPFQIQRTLYHFYKLCVFFLLRFIGSYLKLNSFSFIIFKKKAGCPGDVKR